MVSAIGGSSNELSDCTKSAASFAASLAARYEQAGGNVCDLFSAFAGLVSVRDSATCFACLIALDGQICGDARLGLLPLPLGKN